MKTLLALFAITTLHLGFAAKSHAYATGGFCHVSGTNGIWCIYNQDGANTINVHNNTNYIVGSYCPGSTNAGPEWECTQYQSFICAFVNGQI